MPYYAPASGGTPATTVTDETEAAGTASAVGTSTNYARQDHTHGTEPLNIHQTVLAASYTIPASTNSYVVDGLEIANGIGLEIASGSGLEIG